MVVVIVMVVVSSMLWLLLLVLLFVIVIVVHMILGTLWRLKSPLRSLFHSSISFVVIVFLIGLLIPLKEFTLYVTNWLI